MSGGHFNYFQYQLENIADEMDELIRLAGSYASERTLTRFRETAATVRKAQVMLHRVDWYVSGDDSEAMFHKRLNEDLARLEKGEG